MELDDQSKTSGIQAHDLWRSGPNCKHGLGPMYQQC
jgi:hypothetical protein